MSCSPRVRSTIATIVMVMSTTAAAVLGIAAIVGVVPTSWPPPDAADAAAPIALSSPELEPGVHYASPDIEAIAAPMVDGFAYPWQDILEGWRIDFVAGDSNIAGYTWSRERRIEVFVRPGADADDLRRILAHEIGHAVDVALNDGDERRQWQQQRSLEEAPWWPESGKADFETGAGDFAEAFAYWITGDDSDFRSEIGAVPSAADLELLEVLALDRT